MGRGSNNRSLKEAIDQMLDTYRLKEKYRETSLVGSWEEVMGRYISEHTKELFIKNRKLIVRLDSSTLRHELSYGKEKIRTMLNDHVGFEVIDEVVLK